MRWLAAIFLLLPALAHAEEFTGKVVGVSDGDTIAVLRDGKPVKVRLHGVDCPEKAQAFGQAAKQFTSKLVFGRDVQVIVKATDRDGRTVASVTWRDDRGTARPGIARTTIYEEALDQELLKAGLAWWYRQYAPKQKKLARLEQEARQAKRGLWADAAPVAPWDFRRARRFGGTRSPAPKLNCYQACMQQNAMRAVAIDMIKANCSRRCSTGGAAPLRAGHPDSAAAGPAQAGGLRGNVRSKIFHAAGCKDLARCTHCTATFETRLDAEKAGFRPHEACVARPTQRPSQAEPPSPDRVCRSDGECVFAPRGGCGCSPCGDTWHRAVNKAHADWLRRQYAIESCPRIACTPCPKPVRWLGTKAVCVDGQCEAR